MRLTVPLVSYAPLLHKHFHSAAKLIKNLKYIKWNWPCDFDELYDTKHMLWEWKSSSHESDREIDCTFQYISFEVWSLDKLIIKTASVPLTLSPLKICKISSTGDVMIIIIASIVCSYLLICFNDFNNCI